jgi:hypothetical protein
MGTRQLRLLAPIPPDALRPLIGRLVQLVLTDGEVLHGLLITLEPAALWVQPSPRIANRAVAFALVRELIADQDANR